MVVVTAAYGFILVRKTGIETGKFRAAIFLVLGGPIGYGNIRPVAAVLTVE